MLRFTQMINFQMSIRVITKLPNSEQSSKGKVNVYKELFQDTTVVIRGSISKDR